jgi:hypothetical protein
MSSVTRRAYNSGGGRHPVRLVGLVTCGRQVRLEQRGLPAEGCEERVHDRRRELRPATAPHFSRLHDAVPIIRHHHERWDGQGYPERLAGNAIPQEACIVGLADAWDAMTTDRPYRVALSVDEAAAEVRRCRGTQFSPTIVDAFFAAFRRQPALFEPDTPPARDTPDEPYQVAATA